MEFYIIGRNKKIILAKGVPYMSLKYRKVREFCPDSAVCEQNTINFTSDQAKFWQECFQQKKFENFRRTQPGEQLLNRYLAKLYEAYPEMENFVKKTWVSEPDFDFTPPSHMIPNLEFCNGCGKDLDPPRPNFTVTFFKKNVVFFCEHCHGLAERVANIINRIYNYGISNSPFSFTPSSLQAFVQKVRSEWLQIVKEEQEQEQDDETVLFYNACNEIATKGLETFISNSSGYYQLISEPLLWKLQNNGKNDLSLINGQYVFHEALCKELSIRRLPERAKRQCFLCGIQRYVHFVFYNREYKKEKGLGRKCVDFARTIQEFADTLTEGADVLTKDSYSDEEQRVAIKRLYKKYLEIADKVRTFHCDDPVKHKIKPSLTVVDKLVLADEETSEDQQEVPTNKKKRKQGDQVINILRSIRKEKKRKADLQGPKLDITEFDQAFLQVLKHCEEHDNLMVQLIFDPDTPQVICKTVAWPSNQLDIPSYSRLYEWFQKQMKSSADPEHRSQVRSHYHEQMDRLLVYIYESNTYKGFTIDPKSEALPYANFVMTWE